jgi:hypothetical protein
MRLRATRLRVLTVSMFSIILSHDTNSCEAASSKDRLLGSVIKWMTRSRGLIVSATVLPSLLDVGRGADDVRRLIFGLTTNRNTNRWHHGRTFRHRTPLSTSRYGGIECE